MRVGTDRRSRRVEPAPEAEREAREARTALAREEARAATALATIERRRAYLLAGFRSAYAWARAEGYGPQQARRLLALGRTLVREPDLGKKVADGCVLPETAAQVGRVLREPTLELDPEQRAEWKRRAEEDDPDEVRRDVEKTIEEARQGAPTLPLSFRVTRKTRDGFLRARLLMGQGKRVQPTYGEVLGHLVRDYLFGKDPLERPLPRRRGSADRENGDGDRTGRPRSRTIPSRVRALVQRRSGGTCEICGARPAQEFAHLVPFAKGGSNEADNIGHVCRDCHVLLDAGIYRFCHHDESNRPVVVLDRERLDRVRERAPPPYRARRAVRTAGRRHRTRAPPARAPA